MFSPFICLLTNIANNKANPFCKVKHKNVIYAAFHIDFQKAGLLKIMCLYCAKPINNISLSIPFHSKKLNCIVLNNGYKLKTKNNTNAGTINNKLKVFSLQEEIIILTSSSFVLLSHFELLQLLG